jgi:hypothetical protein
MESWPEGIRGGWGLVSVRRGAVRRGEVDPLSCSLEEGNGERGGCTICGGQGRLIDRTMEQWERWENSPT